LITNLAEERSQIFLQPNLQNQIWTIGRDPNVASLPIRDRRLSRCHAAIHYSNATGFVIYDMNSTNGTYVNGVRIRQSQPMQDGDLIRLGSLNFGFFTGSEFRRVGAPSSEVIRFLSEACVPPTAPMSSAETELRDQAIEDQRLEALSNNLEQTLHFMNRVDLISEE
jgi:pSer/pThr/pTyr-binding forkhead associated (FHA) protein